VKSKDNIHPLTSVKPLDWIAVEVRFAAACSHENLPERF
jgi:hypothetical protein